MNVHEIITNEIIKSLESGSIAWRRGWKVRTAQNYIYKNPYQGINRLLLSLNDYKFPYYLTFNQVNQLGAQIKKGEKGHLVTFWKLLEYKKGESEKENETKEIPYLRYYRVWNIEQTTLALPQETNENNPIEECEKIVSGYVNAPQIKHINGSRCFYVPTTDTITLPEITEFDRSEEYYSTLFHEMTHSTGHKSRLNRLIDNANYGSEDYSKEELIAELGASFLASDTGINQKTLQNSTAYIQGWLKALKNDPKMIIQASSQAEKAVKFIKQELTIDNITKV